VFFIRAFSYGSEGRLKVNKTNMIRDLTGHDIKRDMADKKTDLGVHKNLRVF